MMDAYNLTKFYKGLKWHPKMEHHIFNVPICFLCIYEHVKGFFPYNFTVFSINFCDFYWSIIAKNQITANEITCNSHTKLQNIDFYVIGFKYCSYT